MESIEELMNIGDKYIESERLCKILRIDKKTILQIYGTIYLTHRREIERLKEQFHWLCKYEKGDTWFRREIIPYIIDIINRQKYEPDIIQSVYVPIAIYPKERNK